MPQIARKHPPPPIPPKANAIYRGLVDLASDRQGNGGGIPFSSRFMYIQFISPESPDEFLNLLNTGEEILNRVTHKWQSLNEENKKRLSNGRHKHH